MSTELKDIDSSYGPHDFYVDGDTVSLSAEGSGSTITADMNKAEFISAVETELNGIFIPRDELPEVSIDRDGYWHSIFKTPLEQDENARSFYEDALEALAKSEYLKKNPPVNQKQVDALAAILDEEIVSHETIQDIARRLIATGKVTVSTD